MKKKLFSCLLLSLAIFSNVFVTYAYRDKAEYVKPTSSTGLIPADGTLGEAFLDGSMSLDLMPHYMIYGIDLFSKMAGTIAVAMILYGGLQYVVSGVTEEKESAKNTLKYAVIGLAVTFLAWIGVNMLQIYITAPQPTTEQSP